MLEIYGFFIYYFNFTYNINAEYNLRSELFIMYGGYEGDKWKEKNSANPYIFNEIIYISTHLHITHLINLADLYTYLCKVIIELINFLLIK